MKPILLSLSTVGKEGFISVANEPLVIFRRDDVKVVMIENQATPVVVGPARSTSIVISRSDIPGAPGPKGDKGDPGELVVGGMPEVIDGGNF
jgi:hypothetical protein